MISNGQRARSVPEDGEVIIHHFHAAFGDEIHLAPDAAFVEDDIARQVDLRFQSQHDGAHAVRIDAVSGSTNAEGK